MFNIESLESRQFLSASYTTLASAAGTVVQPNGAYGSLLEGDGSGTLFLAGIQAHVSKTGTLIVQGSNLRDTIGITRSNPGTALIVGSTGKIQESVFVTTSTATGAKVNYEFDIDRIKRIYVEGAGGSDKLIVDSTVKRPATLVGGNGNDTLIGGPLGDVLSGGAGNDLIEAAGTQETIISDIAQSPQLANQPSGKNSGLAGRLFIPGTKTAAPIATNYVVTGGAVADHPDSADLLLGGAGDDTLHTGSGPDTVNGGAGNDHIVAPNRGTAPKDLTSAGETPVDYNGLTVISIESLDFNAVTISASGLPAGSYQAQYVTASGAVNVIDLISRKS